MKNNNILTLTPLSEDVIVELDSIYTGSWERERTLAKGSLEGYSYGVVTYGTHPAAYVTLPEGHPATDTDYNHVGIDVHGGLTYGDRYDPVTGLTSKKTKTYGWDYAHSPYDFVGSFFEAINPMGLSPKAGKVHTIPEMLEDCLNVIRQSQHMGD